MWDSFRTAETAMPLSFAVQSLISKRRWYDLRGRAWSPGPFWTSLHAESKISSMMDKTCFNLRSVVYTRQNPGASIWAALLNSPGEHARRAFRHAPPRIKGKKCSRSWWNHEKLGAGLGTLNSTIGDTR
jgi:hypothetical protein